jgi:hypothetical protein
MGWFDPACRHTSTSGVLPGRDQSTNTSQKQIASLGKQRRLYYALAASEMVD